MCKNSRKRAGFTIIELVVVIAVIGILAAITVVGYNGIQQKARDTQRDSDISAIQKALEIYYLKNDEYPAGTGSTVINNGWSTTADSSWANLVNELAPEYVSDIPSDPVSKPGANPQSSDKTALNYAYYTNSYSYCGAQPRQMYILVWKYESKDRKDILEGDCLTSPLYYPNSNNLRVVK